MQLLITQKEAAKALGVCAYTLRHWKECPRVKISRSKTGKARYRYNMQQVRAWLDSRTAGTPGKEVEV